MELTKFDIKFKEETEFGKLKEGDIFLASEFGFFTPFVDYEFKDGVLTALKECNYNLFMKIRDNSYVFINCQERKGKTVTCSEKRVQHISAVNLDTGDLCYLKKDTKVKAVSGSIGIKNEEDGDVKDGDVKVKSLFTLVKDYSSNKWNEKLSEKIKVDMRIGTLERNRVDADMDYGLSEDKLKKLEYVYGIGFDRKIFHLSDEQVEKIKSKYYGAEFVWGEIAKSFPYLDCELWTSGVIICYDEKKDKWNWFPCAEGDLCGCNVGGRGYRSLGYAKDGGRAICEEEVEIVSPC